MRILKTIIIFCIGYIISSLMPLNFTFFECITFGCITAILADLYRKNHFVNLFTNIITVLLAAYFALILLPVDELCNNNTLLLSLVYILFVFIGLKVLGVSFPPKKKTIHKNATTNNSSTPRLYHHANLYFIIVENKMAQGFVPGTSGTTWFEKYYIYSSLVDVFISVEGTLEIKTNAEVSQAPSVKFLSLYDNSLLDEVIYTGNLIEYKNNLAKLSSKYSYQNLYVTDSTKYINEYKRNFIETQKSERANDNFTRDNNASTASTTTSTNSSFPFSLFVGCKDADSLKKRYLQLLKVYHPDNSNGDTEMTKEIQNAYNLLKSQL